MFDANIKQLSRDDYGPAVSTVYYKKSKRASKKNYMRIGTWNCDGFTPTKQKANLLMMVLIKKMTKLMIF